MANLKYYKVVVIESERGWGQKVDDVRYFREKEAADDFVKRHNAENNLPYVPDIYWRAETPHEVTIDEGLAKLIREDILREHRSKARRKGRRPGVLVG